MQHPDEIIVVVGNTEYVMDTPKSIAHFCTTYVSTFGPKSRQPRPKGLYHTPEQSGSESSGENSSEISGSEDHPPRKKSAIQKEKPRSGRTHKAKPEQKSRTSSQVLHRDSSRKEKHSKPGHKSSKKEKKKRRSSSESEEAPGYRKMKLSYKTAGKDDDVMVRAKKMAQKGTSHFTDVPGREKRPGEE